MQASERSGLRLYVIFIAILLVFVTAAYFLGRWQGTQFAADLREEAPAVGETVTSGAEAAGVAAELQGRLQMLEARRRLHLALMALEQRNFGQAQDHLGAAGAELAVAQPVHLNTRLAQEIQSAKLTASEDLYAQRRRILEWAHELDEQLATTAEPRPRPDTAAEDGTPAANYVPSEAEGTARTTAPKGAATSP